MNYYYALLNSYSLLKKRRFKLSIQEQGDGDLASLSQEEKVKKLVSSAGDKDSPGNIQGVDGNVELWAQEGDILGKDPQDVGPTGQVQTATLVKDNQPGKSPMGIKLWNKIFGSPPEEPKEEPGAEGEEEGDAVDQDEVEASEVLPGEEQKIGMTPYAEQAAKIADDLADALIDEEDEEGIEDEDEDEEEEDVEDAEDAEEQEIEDEDEETEEDATEVDTDEEDAAATIEQVRADELAELETIARNSEENTDYTPEEIAKTFEALAAVLTLAKQITQMRAQAGEGKFTAKINDLIDKYEISIDEHGCMKFFTDSIPAPDGGTGVSVGICNSDSLRGRATQRAFDAIQEVQRKTKKRDGIASTAVQVKKQKDKKDKGSSDAHRGVGIENADHFAPLMARCMEEVDAAKKAKCAGDLHKDMQDSMLRRRKWEQEKLRYEEEKDRWKKEKAKCNKIKKSKYEEDGITKTRDVCHQKNEFEMADGTMVSTWDETGLKPMRTPPWDEETFGPKNKATGASFQQLSKSLAVGILAEDSLILVGEGEEWQRTSTNWLIGRLMKVSGMTEEQAREYVKGVAGVDEDGEYNPENADPLKALLLVMMANRGFSDAIHGVKLGPDGKPIPGTGIIPTRTEGVGQGQAVDSEGNKLASNNVGAKMDVVDIYCPEGDNATTKEKLIENIKSLLSEEQIEHYGNKCGKKPKDDAAAKKNVNDAIGEMIKEPKGEDTEGNPVPNAGCMVVGREPKTHDSTKKPSTLGETSHSKQQTFFNAICGADFKTQGAKPLSKRETDRAEAVKKEMMDCAAGGNEAERKAAGEAKLKGACEINKKLQAKTKRVDDILTGQDYVTGIPTAASEMITGWIGPKPWNAKKKKRKAAAERCLKKQDKGRGAAQKEKNRTEDCEHLTKMINEIKNQEYNKLLDEHTCTGKEKEGTCVGKQKGEVTGAARDFLQAMYLTTAGSDTECINEKRGLSDNVSKCGLRNAEISANLGEDTVFIRSGQTISISGPAGIRATMNAEGSTYKVRTGNAKGLYHEIYDEQTVAEKREDIERRREARFKRAQTRDLNKAMEEGPPPGKKTKKWNKKDKEAWKKEHELRFEAGQEMGADLHKKWQENFRAAQKAAGKVPPYERMKTTTDQDWIDKNGTDQIDIANTSFSELPVDKQEDNSTAADVAVAAVANHGKDREAAGAEIHDKWLAGQGKYVFDDDDNDTPEQKQEKLDMRRGWNGGVYSLDDQGKLVFSDTDELGNKVPPLSQAQKDKDLVHFDDATERLKSAKKTVKKKATKKKAKKKTPKKKTPKKKTPKKKAENSELFVSYLEGQQRLLEALLNQTTKNPNT